MEALRPMGLANVRFAVAIEPTTATEDGADAVQFLFSANPGQPLAPLAEVASGGEMSRFLLALKTCLAAADPHVTLLSFNFLVNISKSLRTFRMLGLGWSWMLRLVHYVIDIRRFN